MKTNMITRAIRKCCFGLTALLLTALGITVHGQDSIVYFSGPSFQFHYGVTFPPGPGLDMDADGTEDLAFVQGLFLCTADVPTSGCSSPFFVTALGTNAVLQRLGQATVLPFGAWIGNPPPTTNSTWSNPSQSANVATYHISPRFGTSALVGPLSQVGVGYLGVRLFSEDGFHYGWVRLQSAPFVGVVDWAYESRPNVPIQAGVIGAQSESLQFNVTFKGPDHRLPDPFATFILTGDNLRGELTLMGMYMSADIVGPARANPNRAGTLGEPLAYRSDFTSFFGNITLSESQIVQLLRGGYYVSVEQGKVIGRISLSK